MAQIIVITTVRITGSNGLLSRSQQTMSKSQGKSSCHHILHLCQQSSSFQFPYVFTKCLFSVSQSASVLNTFFRQILPITLPVGFIIFKTRFRAVMQPLRPCGGAKIQRQVFLAPQAYSFHCTRQFPAAIPHLLTQHEMLPISNTAQNPRQGLLCPQVKRTAFPEGQRRCSNRVPTLSAYLCIKRTLNDNKSSNRMCGAFQKSLLLEEFQATQGTLQSCSKREVKQQFLEAYIFLL